MDAASAVEPDKAVTSWQQDQECAGSLSSEKKHPFGPARNGYIRDDRVPPAAAGYQLYGRCCTDFDRGGWKRERSRLR